MPVPEGWWQYGRFADSTPVTATIRRFYATRWDLAAFDDPFSSGEGSLLAWLQAHEPGLIEATPDASAAS